MGRTTNTTCARDDMEVIINVIGETSEEQTSHAHHIDAYEACQSHKQHRDLQTEGLHVPKTWSCVHEAMLHTTLKKYTTNVQLKKVNVDHRTIIEFKYLKYFV